MNATRLATRLNVLNVKKLVAAGFALSSLIALGAALPALGSDTAEAIAQRMSPFGMVCRAEHPCAEARAQARLAAQALTSAPPVPETGESIYEQYCSVCHDAGIGGAPLFGSLEQWQPRLDKGREELLATSLSGLNAMPPMGTCMSCSETNMRQAIDYMLENAL